MIVKFQARLLDEFQSQTQEVGSLGAEVDEYAITRRVPSERHGHVKGVGRKMKGIGSSTSSTATSHANFAHASSSAGLIHVYLANAQANSQQYWQSLDVMEDSMHSMSQFLPNYKLRCLIFGLPLPSHNFSSIIHSVIRMRKKRMMMKMKMKN